MTSRLHFELFMQEMRIRAAVPGSKLPVAAAMRLQTNEDVGSLRLSQIEAAMKETRAHRADE
jgi:hypothetical protein